MPRSLEELHKTLLQLTLILLHVITYGFIIWSVLCHHGIIDCEKKTPAVCACHAAANPLTAHYGITHGIAIGILLPHVIRFNAAAVGALYSDLAHQSALLNGDALAAAEAGIERSDRLALALKRRAGQDPGDRRVHVDRAAILQAGPSRRRRRDRRAG